MKTKNKYIDLGKWLLLTVSLSLLPIFFDLIHMFLFSSKIFLPELFAKGQLLIISANILAATIADFIVNNRRSNVYAKLSCLILFFVVAVTYGFSLFATNTIKVVNLSIIFFAFSFSTSAWVYLPRLSQEMNDVNY